MALEAVAEAAVEEVAANLEEAAAVTRAINTQVVGAFMGGTAFGVILGFYFGYRFNKARLKIAAAKDAAEEIDKIRQAYAARERGVTVEVPSGAGDEDVIQYYSSSTGAHPMARKPSVEEIVEQRGYSTPEAAEADTEPRPLRPPVPVTPPVNFARPDRTTLVGQWSYAREQATRTPNHPYIIHHDEFFDTDSTYEKTSYILYEGDTTLVGEDGQPLADANTVVGMGNFRFGYGSEDENIVYIRNDRLSLDIEITRNPGSYEEEVLGLDKHDQT